MLEVVTKSAAIVTCVAFVLAMRLYFVRSDDDSSANRKWTLVALSIVCLHLYFVASAVGRSNFVLCVGCTLFVLANLLFWSAVWSHGRKRPNVAFGEAVPDYLVTTGPYALIRHPFYAAYSIAFLGSSIVGNHWCLYATTGVIFACYNAAAGREESLLKSSDSIRGQRYSDYLDRTWRWIPGIW